ncbi:MAG: glyceraldehyde 3-phosphate dehydrogenase NAD-binding domain-containing protein, partial [Verrucomicrobiales bacterium]|nr:glyceraldehyde 3-phosphate dehydrogenase NAD-binding domain-containing protein [Verrucomicrobiales bacterium]
MGIKIGINGFGRIGRLAFRAAFDNPDIDIVHVNELKGGAELAAHLLEFDTVHGRWDRDIEATKAGFSVEGKPVSFSEFASPGEIDWAGLGVEIVIDSSG